MHKNAFWLSFLTLVALVVLIYTGKTAITVYRHEQLSAKTLPKKIEWAVTKRSNDAYFVTANYTFTLKNSEYNGKTTFNPPLFRNSWAAENAIKEFNDKTWTVWYNANSAEQSTMDKRFPLKEMFYVCTLWGLLFYFIWLGYYVGKYTQRK